MDNDANEAAAQPTHDQSQHYEGASTSQQPTSITEAKRLKNQ